MSLKATLKRSGAFMGSPYVTLLLKQDARAPRAHGLNGLRCRRLQVCELLGSLLRAVGTQRA